MESDRPRTNQPSFWLEIYWFAAICLAGWIAAVLVLSPRLARQRSSATVEEEVQDSIARITRLEREYEAGMHALENDMFYREEVIRKVLGVKKKNEEFLKGLEPVSDN